MRNFDDDDGERTLALSGDDLEPISLPHVDEDAITGQLHRDHARQLRQMEHDAQAHGQSQADQDDASMRERTVPFYNPEATTDEPPVGQRSGAPAFVPPPFPGAAFVRPLPAPSAPRMPMRPSPVITEQQHGDSGPSSAFAPISTFPPATVRSPPTSRDGRAKAQANSGEAPTKTPAWVVGYLALCAALTLIGLVVLFFERRMLGSASPF